MLITNEFWATTAQVIPALLLAVVLAERTDRPKRAEPSPGSPPPKSLSVVFSTAMLVSIALGVSAEFLALDGLLGGGGRGSARVVVIAIGVLAFWVVAVAAMRRGGRFFPEEDDDALDRLPLGRSLAVTTVAVGHFLIAFAVAVLPLAAAIWLAVRI
ncbi:hypothetical protein Q5425_29565 [Amycolatopsis sp. A133]|uniref:hypothetical protein n=1 Tax=Amycolatopsis sp. A133 TaxID=3064472 RepID=UPI0027FDA0E4|nr:hypothetical protein [Amycolatopsis sp. A133]MDQ7807905.1 hypothetical protein [Amycolatopsis sp. A133]